MTATAAHTISLSDLDAVLPKTYEILHMSDPALQESSAMRVVRHTTTGQTYAFQTARQYLHFVLSITPRRLFTEVAHTRYIELSSQYDSDPFFHASITCTVAAITRQMVVLHRMKSDEISVRFELSRAEMVALIAGYQSCLDDAKQEEADEEVARDPFLDFPDDLA